jgi:hypothetical protein
MMPYDPMDGNHAGPEWPAVLLAAIIVGAALLLQLAHWIHR